MIVGTLIDFKDPVELLQHHNPCQMVGKGHGGHGQAHPSLRLQALRQPKGPSDDKGQMLGAVVLPGLDQGGQLLAGPKPALHTQADEAGVGGELGACLLYTSRCV